MAKINMVFDTETKDFHMDVDGKPINSMENVSIYRYNNDGNTVHELNMSLRHPDEEGMRSYTFISANKS